jgi:uncharacterized protein
MATHDEDTQRAANCRIVEDLYAGLDALDVERALAPFAEDAVFEMPFAPSPIPQRVEGKAAIAGFVRRFPTLFRRTRVVDLRVSALADPTRVLAEWRGDWERVDGSPYRNTYVVLFRLRDTQVVLMQEYFNPLVLQPAAPSPST